MAQIKGIEGLTPGELSFEVNRGGKFVMYRYCVSVVFLTMMRGSDVYFVRADQSRLVKGLPWTLLTLLAGWLWRRLRSPRSVTSAGAAP